MSGSETRARPVETTGMPDRQIVTSRLIPAPPAIVWRAWTHPGAIETWWGPDGFTTTTHSREFAAGGQWNFTMHGPDGTDYENHIDFVEIRPHALIRYRHGGGGATEAIRFETDVTFEAEEGGTRVTIIATFPDNAMRDTVARDYGAVEGGRQNLRRMAEWVMANR